MLGKSSVLMMLLVGTGSLVGISSIYTPPNVETQPLQQPQPQPTPQPQPQTQPQKSQSQLGGGLIIPQNKVEAGQNTPQAIQRAEDRKLLDRLMPQIIERMQVTLNFRDNYSPLYKISKDVLAIESLHKAEARCPPGFRVTGGGGQISTMGASYGDNNIVTLMPIPSSRVGMVAKMETGGEIMAYATCLAGQATISLKK